MGNGETQIKKDLELYDEFVKSLKTGQPGDSDIAEEIYKKVKKISQQICSKGGHREWADEIAQDTMMALLTKNYKGEATLSTYIYAVARLEFTRHFKRFRKIEEDELALDECLLDAQSAEMANRILSAIYSDVSLKELFLRTPDLQRKIISVVCELYDDEINEKSRSKRQIVRRVKERANREEDILLKKIDELSVPEKRQRYDDLYNKFKDETITEKENEELLELSDELELLDAKRLEYLSKIAKLRGKSLRETVREFKNMGFKRRPSVSALNELPAT
jgi:hypothetical protein